MDLRCCVSAYVRRASKCYRRLPKFRAHEGDGSPPNRYRCRRAPSDSRDSALPYSPWSSGRRPVQADRDGRNSVWSERTRRGSSKAPELEFRHRGRPHSVCSKMGAPSSHHNADEALQSRHRIMKLLTTAAALYYLGPSYRFRTEVATTSPSVRRTVCFKGDLHIKLAVRGSRPSRRKTLFGLVNEVAMRGIKRTSPANLDGRRRRSSTDVFEGAGLGPGDRRPRVCGAGGRDCPSTSIRSKRP